MWEIEKLNSNKIPKIKTTFSIDKHLYEQFKRVAQKDMRKYSNIVEGSMRRYVQSKL
jgi:metal-responsive CopG/Arc/MetJ family transcriptional regulator